MSVKYDSDPAGSDQGDWHIDLAIDYVTHVPTNIGFSVGFLPRDFESDGLSVHDFIAEPVDFPSWGEVPGYEELARLCHVAAILFAQRFIASLNPGDFDSRFTDVDADAA